MGKENDPVASSSTVALVRKFSATERRHPKSWDEWVCWLLRADVAQGFRRDLAWPVCDSIEWNTWAVFFQVQHINTALYVKTQELIWRSAGVKNQLTGVSFMLFCVIIKSQGIQSCLFFCLLDTTWVHKSVRHIKLPVSVSYFCKVYQLLSRFGNYKWKFLRQRTRFWMLHSQGK